MQSKTKVKLVLRDFHEESWRNLKAFGLSDTQDTILQFLSISHHEVIGQKAAVL